MAHTMLAGCSGRVLRNRPRMVLRGRPPRLRPGRKTEPAARAERVMTYAMQKEPETLDPTMNNYATSSIVLQNLLTGLMQIDRTAA